jgi:putative ABC transport system permease protein
MAMMRWFFTSLFVVAGFISPIQSQVEPEWRLIEDETKITQATDDRENPEQKFKRAGLNLIVVRAGGRTGGGEGRLTAADAEAIRRSADKLLIGVAPVQLGGSEKVASRSGNWNSSVVGCTPELEQVRGWRLSAGRFLTADDVKKQADVCLIGQTVRTKLFAKDVDPLRESIRVGDVQLQVVGVLEEKGKGLSGADQDDQILIPLTTLQQKLVSEQRLSAILIAARSVDQVDGAVQEITRVLREQHRVKEGAEDFDVSSVLELYQLYKQLSGMGAAKDDK